MFQNTMITQNGQTRASTFVDPLTGVTVVFTAKSSTVSVGKEKVPMVNISVRTNQVQAVGTPECDPCNSSTVNSGAEIRMNLIKGDEANLALYKTAVMAFFDQAASEYNLAYGLVPPASAVLAQ